MLANAMLSSVDAHDDTLLTGRNSTISKTRINSTAVMANNVACKAVLRRFAGAEEFFRGFFFLKFLGIMYIPAIKKAAAQVCNGLFVVITVLWQFHPTL